MAKRFIDTGLFDDDWFMDLSKDAKILWLYFITKCDHAGILKINEKLCKVQTDIKDIDTVIKQLGNRLVRVSEQLYFIPKYIDFQYPGFPNSKVRQQLSALDILKKHGLYNEEGLRVSKVLANSYEHIHEHDNDNVGGMGDKKITQEEASINFYIEQVAKAKEYTDVMSEEYVKLCRHICQKGEDGKWRMKYLLKVKKPLSLDDFSKLYEKTKGDVELIKSKIDSFQTNINYYKKYEDIYLCVNNWITRDSK